MYSFALSLTSALDGVGVSATPRPLYPRERPVSIVKEAGWTAGPVWVVRKISPSRGFEPRTFQPVAIPTGLSRPACKCQHNNTGTYLPTPCSRVLRETLTGLQLVKKFPAFYGTRMFITAFTIARHLSLS
jgi:hypothetical protein